MNTHDPNSKKPAAFDARPPGARSPEEREWQAQERAVRNERLGSAPAEDDPLVARYRTIAHALRQPPAGGLPSNFAYEVARLAAARSRVVEVDSRLEQWLVRALVGVMALAGAVVAALYGGQWLQATGALFAETGGVGVSGWVATLAACFAITFGFDWWRRARHGDGDSRA
jgi:hypothetical protein